MPPGSDPTLFIVCGLPASGKTTHGRLLAKSRSATRFSPDEWMETLNISLWDSEARGRIEALQWELARDLLSNRQSVVIEWGTWLRSERALLWEEAVGLGASVELHYLTAPIEVLWDRIRSRGAESPPVRRAQLEGWARAFEAPDDDEIVLYDAYLSV